MTDEDLLADFLAAPPLDAALAGRVHARARAELAPAADAGATAFGSALRGALVPALLTVAVVGRTAQTVEVARTIYDGGAAGTSER